MARRVQIQGTDITMEFPDGTPDEVVQRSVQTRAAELRAQQQPPPVQPAPQREYTGVAGAVGQIPLTTVGRRADGSQPKVSDLYPGAIGAADLAIAGARGLINYPKKFAYGVGTGIGEKLAGGSFTEGYDRGFDEHAAQIERGEGIVRSERLRTPEGVELAQKIGNLPIGLPAQGGPNVGQVPRVRDIGTAVGNVGDYLEHVGGRPLKDAAGVVATVATSRMPGPVGRGPQAEAVRLTRQRGYIAPPETAAGRLPGGEQAWAGSATERMAAGAGRSAGVDDAIAVRNQIVTDRYGARAYATKDFSEEFPSPDGVKRATGDANHAIEELKQLKVLGMVHMPSALPNFANRIADLDKRVAGFPNQKPNPAIADLQNEILTGTPDIENIVDKMRDLRQRSFTHRQTADVAMNELGKAELRAAIILEDVVDGFLTNAGQTSGNPALASIFKRLHSEYQVARSQLSVLHDIRSAMNEMTGTIDAKKIADIDTHPLHPDLQIIADSYHTLGQAGMRNIERAQRGAAIPVSYGDIPMALGSGTAGFLSSGHDPTWAIIAGLVPKAIQLAGKGYVLRGPGVRAVQKVGTTAGRVGGIGIAGGVHLNEGDRP